jgi:hypothetical protein
LPAKAVCLCRGFGLKHRVRQQAGSYRFCVWLGNVGGGRFESGLEMLAEADLGFTRKCRLTQNRCRSALAREGGVSVPWIWTETPGSPASRLLQVLRLAWEMSADTDLGLAWEMSADADLGFTRKCRLAQNRCRSALAAKAVGLCRGFGLVDRVRGASALLQLIPSDESGCCDIR